MNRFLSFIVVAVACSLWLLSCSTPTIEHPATQLPGNGITAQTINASNTTATRVPGGMVSTPIIVTPPESMPITIAEANTSFGLNILRAIAASEWAKDRNSNIFMSPLSFSIALALTTNGMDDDLREAALRTLRLSAVGLPRINADYRSFGEQISSLDTTVKMRMANAVWYANYLTLQSAFNATARNDYKALLEAVNFTNTAETKNRINQWINEATNGFIKNLDLLMDPWTTVVLANAICFKAPWKYPFPAKNTRLANFILEDGSSVLSTMMSLGNTTIKIGAYYRQNEFMAADIPYGNGSYTFTAFLPVDGQTIRTTITKLTLDVWKECANALDKTKDSVFIELVPKFSLETKYKVEDILEKMGFPLKNGFSRVFENGKDHIGQITQKARIEVNEEGTTAAAVTVVAPPIFSLPATLKLDRPFIYFIREKKTGMMLFAGVMMNPATAQ